MKSKLTLGLDNSKRKQSEDMINTSKPPLSVFALIIALILCLLFMLFNMGCSRVINEDLDITVTGTERVVTKESSKYLVYTVHASGSDLGRVEAFENTDALLWGKWDSSTLQASLRTDSTYNVTVGGVRWPFFSVYRNIIRINQDE